MCVAVAGAEDGHLRDGAAAGVRHAGGQASPVLDVVLLCGAFVQFRPKNLTTKSVNIEKNVNNTK